MNKKTKRRYNATYRLRKKGYQVAPREKTVFAKEFKDLPRETILLREEFGFEVQRVIL